jgi:acyl carrier protein
MAVANAALAKSYLVRPICIQDIYQPKGNSMSDTDQNNETPDETPSDPPADETDASEQGSEDSTDESTASDNGDLVDIDSDSPTAQKVFDIVSEQLSVPREDVAIEKSFIDDLKADSLDVVELVMDFEDKFDIEIPDDDYDQIRTVGDAIRYIENKKKASE